MDELASYTADFIVGGSRPTQPFAATDDNDFYRQLREFRNTHPGHAFVPGSIRRNKMELKQLPDPPDLPSNIVPSWEC